MASADDVEDPQPAPSITPLIGVEQPDGLKEEEGARRSPAAGSETVKSSADIYIRVKCIPVDFSTYLAIEKIMYL
ncbi:hypothetical protein EJB05_58102, partial [Eragrostis curvula]